MELFPTLLLRFLSSKALIALQNLDIVAGIVVEPEPELFVSAEPERECIPDLVQDLDPDPT